MSRRDVDHGGHLDTKLTQVGEIQATNVGNSLKNLQIDGIFASDLKRASCTGEAIQRSYKRRSIPLFTNPLMRERNFGLNNGKPRSQVHEFIAETKSSHKGCQMWRECQGECSHQIFWRALNFFFDLCEFAANQSTKPTPDFSSIGSLERFTHTPLLPVLLPLRQPPVSQAFASSLHQLQIKNASSFPVENPPEIMGYAGHFVLVSHGQWIREFNHILYALSERSLGFPAQRQMLAVLENCQFNQFGVAVHCEQLAARATRLRAAVESALETAKNGRCHSCPYELSYLTNRLPIDAICYHARVDAHTVKGCTTTAPAVEAVEDKPAASASSGTETLYFAREDDEYAGLPITRYVNENSLPLPHERINS
ncbi:Fructose-26-bisphosphatase TIGAR [Taenia crassiceps]|uniref:Fructose-26-bisphosphatase TIGAR n=1 Tax=Taenia crassiceps TaxID=6207 RepID=A0ABR4QN46_9CEST